MNPSTLGVARRRPPRRCASGASTSASAVEDSSAGAGPGPGWSPAPPPPSPNTSTTRPGQIVALAVHQAVGGGARRRAGPRARGGRGPLAGGPRKKAWSTGSSLRVSRRTGICERGFQMPRPMKRPSWSVTRHDVAGLGARPPGARPRCRTPRGGRTTAGGPAPGAGPGGRGCRRPCRASGTRTACAAVGSTWRGICVGHGGAVYAASRRCCPCPAATGVLFLLAHDRWPARRVAAAARPSRRRAPRPRPPRRRPRRRPTSSGVAIGGGRRLDPAGQRRAARPTGCSSARCWGGATCWSADRPGAGRRVPLRLPALRPGRHHPRWPRPASGVPIEDVRTLTYYDLSLLQTVVAARSGRFAPVRGAGRRPDHGALRDAGARAGAGRGPRQPAARCGPALGLDVDRGPARPAAGPGAGLRARVPRPRR